MASVAQGARLGQISNHLGLFYNLKNIEALLQQIDKNVVIQILATVILSSVGADIVIVSDNVPIVMPDSQRPHRRPTPPRELEAAKDAGKQKSRQPA